MIVSGGHLSVTVFWGTFLSWVQRLSVVKVSNCVCGNFGRVFFGTFFMMVFVGHIYDGMCGNLTDMALVGTGQY